MKIPHNSAPSSAPQSVGDHICIVRKERGLLQSELAQRIGVIEQCISNWEAHRSQPQIRHYPAIISFLGYYPFNFDLNSTQEKLTRLRYGYGVSYKYLGIMLGVDGSTVRFWEKSRCIIGKQVILQIDALLKKLPHI